jgi:hypothetical protein
VSRDRSRYAYALPSRPITLPREPRCMRFLSRLGHTEVSRRLSDRDPQRPVDPSCVIGHVPPRVRSVARAWQTAASGRVLGHEMLRVGKDGAPSRRGLRSTTAAFPRLNLLQRLSKHHILISCRGLPPHVVRRLGPRLGISDRVGVTLLERVSKPRLLSSASIACREGLRAP